MSSASQTRTASAGNSSGVSKDHRPVTVNCGVNGEQWLLRIQTQMYA